MLNASTSTCCLPSSSVPPPVVDEAVHGHLSAMRMRRRGRHRTAALGIFAFCRSASATRLCTPTSTVTSSRPAPSRWSPRRDPAVLRWCSRRRGSPGRAFLPRRRCHRASRAGPACPVPRSSSATGWGLRRCGGGAALGAGCRCRCCPSRSGWHRGSARRTPARARRWPEQRGAGDGTVEQQREQRDAESAPPGQAVGARRRTLVVGAARPTAGGCVVVVVQRAALRDRQRVVSTPEVCRGAGSSNAGCSRVGSSYAGIGRLSQRRPPV